MTQNHNEITVKTYENAVDKYVNLTTSVVKWEFKDWIDKALSYVSKESKILEIWTWWGRDSDYIESLWYCIQRSDYPDSFIEYNKKRWKEIIKLDILNIDLIEKYDLVFANAVLLHFKKSQVKKILSNVRWILNEWWFFVFSLKKWYWEEFNDAKVDWPRFFKYWQNEEIMNILNSSWFEAKYLENADWNKWIHIICQKSSIKYNKLVRDFIPEIMKKQWKVFDIHTADNDEYQKKLWEKLLEEVEEFNNAENEKIRRGCF